MFETEVTVPLDFRHHLEGFGEEFAKEHEHTWDVTVAVAVESLNQLGVSVDFIKLKKNLANLLEPYQGKLLNELEPFNEIPPTAEHIALRVAEGLSRTYPGLLRAVSVGTGSEKARFIIDT